MNHERITQKVAVWNAARRGGGITALVIYVLLLFIVVQSFLSAPFFSRSKSWSLEAFAFFILPYPDFYLALRSGFILAFAW